MGRVHGSIIMRVHVLCTCVLIFILPSNGKKAFRIKIMPPDKSLSVLKDKTVQRVPVDIRRFPATAIVFNKGALCSGTVLNSWTTLTAAHCFDHNDDTRYISIHVGTRHRNDYRAKLHDVASVRIHEDYNKAMPFACDIALAFVTEEFDFRGVVRKAVLVGDDSWMNEWEKRFVEPGWGLLNSSGSIPEVELSMTTMRFIPRTECGQLHHLTFTPDVFCLSGYEKQSACVENSGGGVLWKKLLVGVVSSGDGCESKDKPRVFSNVLYFRDWIRNTIQKYFDKHCRY